MVEHILQGDKESLLAQVFLLLLVIHVIMVPPRPDNHFPKASAPSTAHKQIWEVPDK